MKIIPAYWAYIDRNNDGAWDTLRVVRGGKWSKRLTIFEVRKQQKLAKVGGYGFRSKRIPARTPKPPKPPANILTIARGELGETEHPAGSNHSKYNKWYGFDGPWCAMFISWLCWKSGIDFHYMYVPYVVGDARAGKNGLSLAVKAAPGVVACYDFDGGVADHIGIIVKVYADGSFDAYEGNTGIGNNAYGGIVMIRRRYPNQVESYVRLPNAAS